MNSRRFNSRVWGRGYSSGGGYGTGRGRRSGRGGGFNRNSSRNEYEGNMKRVDYDESNMSPIRMNLYKEHDDVINIHRIDIGERSYIYAKEMSVYGRDIPKRLMHFKEENFPEYIVRGLYEINFENLTLIQSQGWPIALSGRDMLGIAETGSGKTLAYMLPGVVHIFHQTPSSSDPRDGPIVLVLVPTRELAQQIQSVCIDFGRPANIRNSCVFDGAPKGPQLREIERGAQICIATPGRLIDFIEAGKVGLKNCTFIVLDETDKMLDMGFESQIRKIFEQIRPDRQTLMFSGTLGEEVRKFVKDFLVDYIGVTMYSEVNIFADQNIPDSIMTPTIEDLFPELVVKIFSYYIESEGHMAFSKNVVPVCKSWRHLSLTPSLWKSIEIQNWSYAHSISNRGLLYDTQRLCVNRISVTPSDLMAVLSKIHDLKSLKILGGIVYANAIMIVGNYCPNLEQFLLKLQNCTEFHKITVQDLSPILTICGPKLKHLNFTCCLIEDSEELITEIASKCKSLEIFEWGSLPLSCSIYKLGKGCPQLRKLDLKVCGFVTEVEDNFGFQNLTVFKGFVSNYLNLDVCDLLKNSKNLENLSLRWINGPIFSNISKIPSNKVQILDLSIVDGEETQLVTLEQAVNKWKQALVQFTIWGWRCDITNVLKIFLDENQCPKLTVLKIGRGYVDPSFLKLFLLRCENLKEYQTYEECLTNREDIVKFQDSLCLG